MFPCIPPAGPYLAHWLNPVNLRPICKDLSGNTLHRSGPSDEAHSPWGPSDSMSS